ncbi:UvrD-helicase domain-containing protein (plasmid) [Tunturiibacter gelidiferens]
MFLVGDPRQSVYFFRDAEAELFPRVQNMGLEISEAFQRKRADDAL